MAPNSILFISDTAAVSVVIPQSTTAAPTSTTDRHVTFWEDPRNIAWVTVASVLLCGLVLYSSYLIVRYGNFPCVKTSYKVNARYVRVIYQKIYKLQLDEIIST